MADKALENCPFYDGRALLLKRLSNNGNKELYEVFCTECGNRTRIYYTPKTAIAKWNKRVVK